MPTATAQAPSVQKLQARQAAVATGASAEITAAEAPFPSTVAAFFIPDTVLTGVTTNSRTLQVFNRGQDGLGVVKMAEKAFINTVNAVSQVKTVITAITAADAHVAAAGDVIACNSLFVGTGLAMPPGVWILEFTRL